jgi:SAM-dependent methyltransferase
LTTAAFDYERRVWGLALVTARPWALQGLKLRYCLEDLADVSGTVADIGCGGGNMARAIKRARPDLKVHGIDISRYAILAAQGQPGGVSFETGDAADLPFGDAALDAAVTFDVLEHLADPAAALAEIARVLKPGALFHVAQPLEDQPGTLHRFLRRRGWRAKERHSGHLHAFDAAGFTQLASATGLEVRRVRYSAHHLMTLADVAYYCWLDLARRQPRVATPASSPPRDGPAEVLKSIVAIVGWYESRLLASVPGTCGHFTCARRA